MARTYTLKSTACAGGVHAGWSSATWGDYYAAGSRRAGSVDFDSYTNYYATYFMFDSATLATLKTKPITSITLTVNVTGGTGIEGSTGTSFPVRAKANANTSGGETWRGGGTILGYCRRTSGSSTTFSIPLSTTVPDYGYVIGPYGATPGQNRFQEFGAVETNVYATLVIVTNEYTINYNKGANGTGTNVTDIKTHGTALTLRGAIFSRTGYNQTGWSTSDGGSKAYNLSASYTANADATLYPYWQKITYQVSYNANGGSGAPAAQTKEYGVNLTLSSTVPTRTNYIFQGWATSSSGSVAYQPGGSYTANAAVTLYAIWKLSASTLSSVTSTVNIGSSGTASWNILNSGYTYKLEITCGSAPTVTVNVAANTSSASFTIPTTWYSYFSNATSGTATAKLSTYNGSTLVGTSTKTFTVAVASSVKPTISAFTVNPSSSNSTVNGWGVFVQGYSKANLSVTASAGTGASITSIAFSGVGVSKNSLETTAESPVLTISGSTSYTVTVTDSRGRTATSTATRYINPYANPAISKLEAVRCLSNGTQSDTEGTYLKSRQTFTYSAVDKNTTGGSITAKNSLSIKRLDYKRHDTSSWTTGISSAVSGTSWSSVFGGGNIDIAYSYDVRLTVQDALGTLNAAVLTINVPPITGFHLGFKNDRARFGGVCEKAGLQIDWPVEINNTLDITPRRCYATLSSVGWYRVFDYNALNEARVSGDVAFSIDITILEWARQYHKITLYGILGALKFGSELSVTQTSFIDKIRYWKNGTHGYIDVHYTSGVSRYVACYFDVKCNYPDNLNRFSSMTPTAVVDSPSGSELTTYTFVANTGGKITFTPTSGSVYRACWYARIGNVCYLHVDMQGLTPLTNTKIFTLPVGFRPEYSTTIPGGGQESHGALASCSVQTDGSVYIYSQDHYAIIDGSFICLT